MSSGLFVMPKLASCIWFVRKFLTRLNLVHSFNCSYKKELCIALWTSQKYIEPVHVGLLFYARQCFCFDTKLMFLGYVNWLPVETLSKSTNKFDVHDPMRYPNPGPIFCRTNKIPVKIRSLKLWRNLCTNGQPQAIKCNWLFLLTQVF